jgi:hypothetical protein
MPPDSWTPTRKEEQQQAEAAADEVAHAPAFRPDQGADGVDMVGHVAGDHRAEDADGGDDGRAVAWRRSSDKDSETSAMQPPSSPAEAEAGDETPEGIGLEAYGPGRWRCSRRE